MVGKVILVHERTNLEGWQFPEQDSDETRPPQDERLKCGWLLSVCQVNDLGMDSRERVDE